MDTTITPKIVSKKAQNDPKKSKKVNSQKIDNLTNLSVYISSPQKPLGLSAYTESSSMGLLKAQRDIQSNSQKTKKNQTRWKSSVNMSKFHKTSWTSMSEPQKHFSVLTATRNSRVG